jgi:glycosyltransferase involved in cell wall biosynthesis
MEDKKLDILKIIRENPQLTNEVGKADHPENYPYFDKPATVTVTFVSPILTGDYVYKMIYPAIALNEYSETHRAFMVGIQDFIARQKLDEYPTSLPDTFIPISNYLVLPFYTFDLRDWIEKVKYINPAIKIAYCIDINFLRVPTSYSLYKDYESRAVKDAIIENMRASDIVLITQTALGEFLFHELKERLSGASTIIEVMPCGFFPDLTEPIIRGDLPVIDHTKFRIGMILNATHFDDVNCIREQLIEIQTKYKDKVELISFGWKGIADFGKGLRDVFRGIPYTYQRPVNFYEYHKKIADLQLDCLLIPVKMIEDSGFTITTKNNRKFIEASAMGIPCLITATPPYFNTKYVGDSLTIIDPNMNAVMIAKKTDWVTQLSEAIEDKSEKTKLDEISERAYQVAHGRFTYDKIVNLIERIFE